MSTSRSRSATAAFLVPPLPMLGQLLVPPLARGPVNGGVAYGVASGGSPLWSESYASVSVSGGMFDVLPGSNTRLPVGSIFTGQALWIDTIVDGNAIAPRRPIVSVAYAARAARPSPPRHRYYAHRTIPHPECRA